MGLPRKNVNHWNKASNCVDQLAAKATVVDQVSMYAEHALKNFNKDMLEEVSDNLIACEGVCVDCVTLLRVPYFAMPRDFLENVAGLGVYCESSDWQKTLGQDTNATSI